MPTRSQIKRSQLLADALRQSAIDSSPKGHWTQVLGQVVSGFGAGVLDRRADRMEQERNKALANALSSGMTPNEMRNLGAAGDYPELFPMADRREDQANWQQRFDYEKGRDAVADSHWGQQFNYQKGRDAKADQQWGADQGWKAKQFGLEREKFDWSKNAPPDPTADMQEYNFYAAQERAAGRQPVDWYTYQTGIKKAGATSIQNTVGGDSNALNKALDEAEGKEWGAYREGAVGGARIMQSMEALDALSQSAPQGPITGRLVEMFPGFSTAGDAFASVTSELAPSLRTPGSGSTSDIEYEGFLKSLPRLRNSAGGNQIISGILKAKARINIERGQIVDAYRMNQIDANTARRKLGELNQRSIMTPEMKAMIGGGDSSPHPQYDLDAINEELRRRGAQQ